MSPFTDTVTAAASAVAEALDAHRPRGGEPYPSGAVLPVVAEQHEVLLVAVAGCAEPLPDPLGAELAGLMSYLQLLRVRYHRLAEVPAKQAIFAGRAVTATHVEARRVRDRAKRM